MSGAILAQPGGSAAEAVATVRSLAGEVTAFVLGPAEAELAAAAAAGADRVVVLEGPGLTGDVPAGAAAVALAEGCRRRGIDLLVLPATARWREVAAQLVILLDGACVTDATAVRRDGDGTLLAERLVYGGLAVATVALDRSPAILTMAQPAAAGSGAGVPAGAFETEAVEAPASGHVILERTPVEASIDLDGAPRIVAAGRGLRRQEDLALVEALASAMAAELGCSRPLVEDLHWLPPERQVGLTGRTVKPELYLAVGISGQVQHLVGMRDAGTIVAINSNPQAPIFGVVDIGVVGDLYEIVPRLTAALAARRVPAG